MNNAIKIMLEQYNLQDKSDKTNAIKEIMQSIALEGLSKGGFFTKAAFYGGTCLRLFYGLDRFSEDLDFALLEPDKSFSLSEYFPYLKKTFMSYGIDIEIDSKEKTKDRGVQSAFLKSNTIMLLASFFPKSEETKKVIPNQKIKIKFEIDVTNPSGGRTEFKYVYSPQLFEVRVFDESTLFAGKIHAILCRDYQKRVKGRDYYDYLFYIGKGTPINLKYLENKLKNTGNILSLDESLSLEKLKMLLRNKFENVDYNAAIDDVSKFVSNKDSLSLWSKELFLSTIEKIK